METWIIISIVVILFIMLFNYGKKQNDKDKIQAKQNKEKFKRMGFGLFDNIKIGKYLTGHPDIDKSIERATLYPKEGVLHIFYQESELFPFTTMPKEKGQIEISTIQDITIEDASTIEKNVSFKRMMLVGVFAFAWKKKKKNELAYLAIKWNDGKFEHQTIFEYEGIGAMENANIARNKLIKIVR